MDAGSRSVQSADVHGLGSGQPKVIYQKASADRYVNGLTG